MTESGSFAAARLSAGPDQLKPFPSYRSDRRSRRNLPFLFHQAPRRESALIAVVQGADRRSRK